MRPLYPWATPRASSLHDIVIPADIIEPRPRRAVVVALVGGAIAALVTTILTLA